SQNTATPANTMPGAGTVGVMAASAPGIVLAGVAVFWLMHRQQRAAMV
ncbi:hypothetical protein, partial [Klebsiella pneumoniae]